MKNNFIEVAGTGTIYLEDNTFSDVLVYGYFPYERWWFFICQDSRDNSCFTVSEASTGCRISDYYYTDIHYALEDSLRILKEKRYYLSTVVGNWSVKMQRNLLIRNTTGLQTLAVDSLWL